MCVQAQLTGLHVLTSNGHLVVPSIGIIHVPLYKGGFTYSRVTNDDDLEQYFCHRLEYHSELSSYATNLPRSTGDKVHIVN